MNGYRIWLSKLALIIFRVNQEIDAGRTLDVPETLNAAGEERAMEFLKSHLDLTNRRFEMQILTDEDCAFLNSHFSAYAASTPDYWPIENNGFCLFIAWTAELVQQKHWSDFADIDETP